MRVLQERCVRVGAGEGVGRDPSDPLLLRGQVPSRVGRLLSQLSYEMVFPKYTENEQFKISYTIN